VNSFGCVVDLRFVVLILLTENKDTFTLAQLFSIRFK